MSHEQSIFGGPESGPGASAAVNIARGAAAGGVYGAAVEAAKSFLPELIRLFVILLCVVLLVPMLVFHSTSQHSFRLLQALPTRKSSTSPRLLRSLTGYIKIWTITSSLRFCAW